MATSTVTSHTFSAVPRPRGRQPTTLMLALFFAASFAVAWCACTGWMSHSGPSVVQASDTISQPASSGATTSASALPTAPKNFFGFTPDFGPVDDATLSAYYTHMKKGGASWVRFGVYWWYIEKPEGNFTWGSTDRFFAAAACSGLVALPMFIGSPPWASGRSSTIAPPLPENFPQYKAMIRAAIARYGVGGSYWTEQHKCADHTTPVPDAPSSVWQVWNEPNVMDYYGDQTATAQGYARLLAAADDAINTSVNPSAKTVMGGLTGSKAGDFLAALYKALPNLNSHVDIFDVHAYATTPWNSLNLLRTFRQAADSHGAAAKPIWVSEVAWSSCRQAGNSYPAACTDNILAKNEVGQRYYLTRLYNKLIANASALRLQRVAWYSWRDPDVSRATCNFCYGSSLFHRDDSPKPAWAAYVRLAGGQL